MNRGVRERMFESFGHGWMRRTFLSCLLLLLGQIAAAQQNGPPPWQRTETRADCANFSLLRNPFFGETHTHTTYSFDAVSGDTRAGPLEAYEFAKGAPLGLPPFDANGVAQRTVQLRRPLDFAAVTDHAETIGEVQICLTPGLSGYDSLECQTFRDAIPQTEQASSPGVSLFGILSTSKNPVRYDFCGEGGQICLDAFSPVWKDTQDAAEQQYDRTDACAFTTLVGYEWTGNPGVQNIHRNVLFRNAVVPELPISYIEQPTPQGLWAALHEQCLDAGAGCDALIIPHNSNFSNGIMFVPENADGSPIDAAAALERSFMEPLVEVFQHKADSECRPGVMTSDELCGFEKWPANLVGLPAFPNATYPPSSFVRNALKIGLEQEEAIGANPFRFGLIGATDTHNATPGLTNEEDYAGAGHLGTRDATPALMVSPLRIGVVGGIYSNAGGLAVVWAEENSRDALFAAMRRKEVYATSGTRPIVRFFAGDFKDDLCDGGDLADTGYRRGVPMGGEIGALLKSKSPAFAVLATQDPQAGATPLQRVQIIKGRLDDNGDSQEKVFEVAGDPNNGASVDTGTCETSGAGFDTLCAVWRDPEFDPAERAFYYARVVENPVCRWSTRLCNDAGVDCGDAATIPAGMDECCNPDIEKSIQERAWSSPIWYRPESFGQFKAAVKVKGGGQDALKLKASLQRVPPELDPNSEDITLTLTDDDTIYTVTIPAGTMQEKKPGAMWILSDKTGAIGGLKKAILKINAKGDGALSLKTVKLDLPGADLTDHFVETTLQAGGYRAQHTRLWQVKGINLKPEN